MRELFRTILYFGSVVLPIRDCWRGFCVGVRRGHEDYIRDVVQSKEALQMELFREASKGGI